MKKNSNMINAGTYVQMNKKHLENSSLPPAITPSMYKGLSEYRKATLQEEVNQGYYRDGTAGQVKEGYLTANGNVVSSASFSKFAQSTNLTLGSGWRGGNGDTLRQSPEVYSPLWLNSNLSFPRDRATINAWCRAFFNLNPIVQNAINLHSTYPISKLNIRCANKDVEKFFNEMIEELNLMEMCVQIAQEYWLLGEAFVYAELDERNKKWSRLIIQNPDYIIVKRSVIANEPIIMLRPDQTLMNIVTGNKPSDIEQRSMLNESIISHVKRGENIPLDNFNVSHLARKPAPYEIRGTGLPVCIFRQLSLLDQIRECKFVQAQDLINPITLIKIGSADYKPTSGDLEVWRNTWENATYDKNFKIFTHEGVAVERVGANSAIIDTSGDITQLLKEMYAGLMVPPVVMDGGADTTYANGGVALDVLRQRYISFRDMMSGWLRRKIFAPISKLNEFYEYKNGKKVLIIPEIDWNHMSLFDAGDYITTLTNLLEKKSVSLQTVYRSLGLEWEEEQRKMRKEKIAQVISDKELENLKRMSLNELRALTDEDEIADIQESPVPGESQYEAGKPESGEESSEGGMESGTSELPSLPGT